MLITTGFIAVAYDPDGLDNKDDESNDNPSLTTAADNDKKPGENPENGDDDSLDNNAPPYNDGCGWKEADIDAFDPCHHLYRMYWDTWHILEDIVSGHIYDPDSDLFEYYHDLLGQIFRTILRVNCSLYGLYSQPNCPCQDIIDIHEENMLELDVEILDTYGDLLNIN